MGCIQDLSRSVGAGDGPTQGIHPGPPSHPKLRMRTQKFDRKTWRFLRIYLDLPDLSASWILIWTWKPWSIDASFSGTSRTGTIWITCHHPAVCPAELTVKRTSFPASSRVGTVNFGICSFRRSFGSRVRVADLVTWSLPSSGCRNPLAGNSWNSSVPQRPHPGEISDKVSVWLTKSHQ